MQAVFVLFVMLLGVSYGELCLLIQSMLCCGNKYKDFDVVFSVTVSSAAYRLVALCWCHWEYLRMSCPAFSFHAALYWYIIPRPGATWPLFMGLKSIFTVKSSCFYSKQMLDILDNTFLYFKGYDCNFNSSIF